MAAIDVGRNELRGGAAGLPAAFALATRECMVAIANTFPELVVRFAAGPMQCSAGLFGKRYKCFTCRLCGEMSLA